MKDNLKQFFEEWREETRDMVLQMLETPPVGMDSIKALRSGILMVIRDLKKGGLCQSIRLYAAEGSMEINPMRRLSHSTSFKKH